MAKTNPIGVRFDEEILELIKKEQKLSSPQKVVNYLLENYGKSKPLPSKSEDLKKDDPIVVKKKEAVKSPKNDKLEMPKGLNLEERIYWMEKNK